jgi:hypothetical protein
MRFEHLPDADQSYDRHDCDDSWGYNGVFFLPESPDALGSTSQCVHDSSNPDVDNAMHKFAITINSNKTWWDNAANGPNDVHDFGGAMTHEVGHGTGWEGHITGDPCNESDGFPKNTMCPEVDTVRYGFRSLETHDQHTFDDEYPDF